MLIYLFNYFFHSFKTNQNSLVVFLIYTWRNFWMVFAKNDENLMFKQKKVFSWTSDIKNFIKEPNKNVIIKNFKSMVSCRISGRDRKYCSRMAHLSTSTTFVERSTDCEKASTNHWSTTLLWPTVYDHGGSQQRRRVERDRGEVLANSWRDPDHGAGLWMAYWGNNYWEGELNNFSASLRKKLEANFSNPWGKMLKHTGISL